MKYVVGVDEAGYGPNLGPLVVASSCWRVPDNTHTAWPIQFSNAWNTLHQGKKVIAIGDSKKLFQGRRDLAHLEAVVLACFGTLRRHDARNATRLTATSERRAIPTNWDELCASLHTETKLPRDYDASKACLPLGDHEPERFDMIAANWRVAEQAAGAELVGLYGRIVFPGEWNELLQRWNNKSTVLSRISLSLLQRTLDDMPRGATVEAHCDKHGGRNHYAALLSDVLPVDGLVHTIREGMDASEYRLAADNRTIRLGFYRKGESFLPVALASMVAKYVREVAMASLNAFWRRHLPHLRPTAGYPTDAKRFASEIESLRAALDIDPNDLWRAK